jgi:hypothetical protein
MLEGISTRVVFIGIQGYLCGHLGWKPDADVSRTGDLGKNTVQDANLELQKYAYWSANSPVATMPVSDPAREVRFGIKKVRFMVKKVLSCEQERCSRQSPTVLHQKNIHVLEILEPRLELFS